MWFHGIEIMDEEASNTALRNEGVVPVALARAAPKRTAEFLAGRHCAVVALRSARAPLTEVAFGPAGSPIWPTGFRGSITHTRRFAYAVVVRNDEYRGVGIDCEQILSPTAADQIAPLVLSKEKEVTVVRGSSTGLEWNIFVSIVFSAKESIYKCLHPIVNEFFEFHDVSLVAVDLEQKVLRMKLARDIGQEFLRGTAIESRFAVADDHVHTVTVIGTASELSS
ncbi:MAG TPA: 4'-phosphopantetheinyl transferase superfamily protein [Gemmatimonadaceae bacterium]|jgi:enterobactin synthetase component D